VGLIVAITFDEKLDPTRGREGGAKPSAPGGKGDKLQRTESIENQRKKKGGRRRRRSGKNRPLRERGLKGKGTTQHLLETNSGKFPGVLGQKTDFPERRGASKENGEVTNTMGTSKQKNLFTAMRAGARGGGRGGRLHTITSTSGVPVGRRTKIFLRVRERSTRGAKGKGALAKPFGP